MPTNASFDCNPNLYPDPTGRALRVCRFVSNLTLWEDVWAGKKFQIHPFQEAIFRRIYGPVRYDGRRQVRTVFIWIPRGNAKTTLAAALGLAHLVGPESVAGGQVICAAADKKNAMIAFNMALKMAKQDPILDGRLRSLDSIKEIHNDKTDSVLRAISTEAYSKHGMNVSMFLADEIHAWPETEARELYTVVTDSMVKRQEPLTIIISTAGEGEGGFAREMWDYSHAVAKGEVDDPTCASIIFEADPSLDWKEESTWLSCNPGMVAGFLNKTDYQQAVKEAGYFPNKARDFKRFKLNLWQSGSSLPWLDMDTYDKAEPFLYSEEERRLIPAYVGIDLAAVEDLTSVVTIFPDEEEEEDDGFDVLAHFFLPEDNLLKKQDRDHAKYIQWAEQGFLTITKGNRTDQRLVLAYVENLKKEYHIDDDSIAIDRWGNIGFTAMANDKDISLIEFQQGFTSMAAPVKEIKRKILSGKFRHGNNPVLRMCFANVITEIDDAENEKFTKKKSRGRIDGATSSAMAIGRYLAAKAQFQERYKGIFSNKINYRKGFNRPEPEPELKTEDKEVDFSILADMSNPFFAEHKARFERQQDKVDRQTSRRHATSWEY